MPDARSTGSELGSQDTDASIKAREQPTRIGPYRVINTLGQGGMGVVYLAEQTEPVRREVAIKVLKMGVDSEQVVARFHMERQTLAVMEHPGITKVFDAGVTESGWPYFVMERVSGVPLTEYADTNTLDVPARIRLFAQVCRAVQHAHQKGIIHRDLKPSNVLVTESDGAPLCKIIDFGIAKATQGVDAAKLTQTGISIGTPTYMSPEQAVSSGLDVDTRSDVYSLGVVLYELLSGVVPFDPTKHGLLGVIARHATTDAAPPGASVSALPTERQLELARLRRTDVVGLKRSLAGDLDWITAKALEKERERRYETAVAFAEDLERHLTQQPVIASPLSGAYRVRKFVRRHRIGVAFAATIALLVVGFAVSVTVQARNLARSRAIAVRRQAQAEDLVGFMLGDLRTRLAAISSLDVLEQVGKKAQEYFAAVPSEELSGAELYRRSQALSQLGQVRMSQAKLDSAMSLFRQSLALQEKVVQSDTLNGEWQLGLGSSRFYVGYVHFSEGRLDSALAHFYPYLRITETLIKREPANLTYRLELASATSNIGSVKERQGDLAGALAAFQSTIEAKEFVARNDSTNLRRRLDLANTINSAGVIQRKLGDLAGAERLFRQELAIKQVLVRRDSANREYQLRLASGHAFLGDLLIIQGNPAAARPELVASRDLYASLAARDTSNVDVRNFRGNGHRLVGVAALERGDAASAVRELRAGRALLDPLITHGPSTPAGQNMLGRALASLGFALSEAGQRSEGEAVERRALSIFDAALKSRPRDQAARLAVSDASFNLGEILLGKNDRRGARAAWAQALTTIDSLARVGKMTDHLASQSAAMLRLDRIDDARPVVQELLRRGYRRPAWMALVRDKKVVLSP